MIIVSPGVKHESRWADCKWYVTYVQSLCSSQPISGVKVGGWRMSVSVRWLPKIGPFDPYSGLFLTRSQPNLAWPYPMRMGLGSGSWDSLPTTVRSREGVTTPDSPGRGWSGREWFRGVGPVGKWSKSQGIRPGRVGPGQVRVGQGRLGRLGYVRYCS